MKRNIAIIGTLLLLGLQFKAKAQYVLKAADVQFELYNYSRATGLYAQAWNKKESQYVAARLASCYGFQQNYVQCEKWWAIAVGLPNSPAKNRLDYARALQRNAKYSEAKVQFAAYAAQDTALSPERKQKWLQACDSALSWIKLPKQVQVINEKDWNSPQSDWGAVKYKTGVVFSSDRPAPHQGLQQARSAFLKFDGAKLPDQQVYGWTGNAYLQLYTSTGTASLKLFPIDEASVYHVGPASFTADGNEVFFTLTRMAQEPAYTKAKVLKGKLATVNIAIYSAKKDSAGQWGQPVAFPYNNVNKFSNGDPHISADGKSLYFSSNRPGGKGGTDLYVSQRNEAGYWGEPVNLAEVNTEGNERTPALGADGRFYFSSDGHIGMGGLDIYSAKLTGGKISSPVNLGYPINSPQDDFSYYCITDKTGYFSSNRTGGLGGDDIYRFTWQN